MKAFFLLCFLVLLDLPVMACLNESHPRLTLSGNYIDWDDEIPDSEQEVVTPAGRDVIADWLSNVGRLKELDSLYHSNKNIEYYSDYGVVLVYLDRLEEAKNVFEDIEFKNPGLYATAANLGTVYELLGQNRKALRWIEKAVLINPRSHENSEWIHVNILKVKIKGNGAVSSELLLGTDFGTSVIPVSNDSLAALIRLRKQLYYQLVERMSFVKPQDKIVGQLLFDLGNLYALTSNIKSALEVFDKAKEYGCEEELLAKRYAHLSWLMNRKGYVTSVILVVLLVSGALGIGMVIRRWKTKRRKAAASRMVSKNKA